MRRLLVVLAICFMSLFSFMGISEAAWELSGIDPELGPFWYDTSSIITGKEPGTVCFKLKVNRPDGKGGHMIEHIMIDQSRMYAVIFWGEMTNADGKVVVSTEQRTPLLIAGLTPAWKNVIATVLYIYDNTPPEQRKTFLDYVAPMVVQQDEETKSQGGETKSNDTPASTSSPVIKQSGKLNAGASDTSTASLALEEEALKTMLAYAEALNNKEFEKAYNMLTPEVQKNVNYDQFVKSQSPWTLKVIEPKVISVSETGSFITIRAITEFSRNVEEGTLIRKFRKLMPVVKDPSGWKLAGETSSTLINEEIIK